MKRLKPGDVIYETDAEHGVVEHTIYEVVTVYNTDARDEDGKSWAYQFTDSEIKDGGAFLNREDAEHALIIERENQERMRKQEDQSRA